VANAFEGLYEGEKAIWLKAGSYEAALLPKYGGNLTAFRDAARGYRFLHEPGAEEMERFKARPTVWGIPVLFPPNRYEDGLFPWNGNVYRLPVNEEKTGNHLHGFFLNEEWKVDGFGETGRESYAVIAQRVDKSHPLYKTFPHEFTLKIRYSLSEDGLAMEVGVRNDGDQPMPCALGFHTSINAPFAPGSTAEDYTVRMTIGKRVELNERMLPTGKLLELSEDEEKLRTSGISPYFSPLDNHYTAEPQDGRNRMELTDHRLNVKLVYDAGTAYKFWMIYNAQAGGAFFCPEPQINMVNAPKAPFPPEQIGIVSLAPGEVWQETSRIYAIG